MPNPPTHAGGQQPDDPRAVLLAALTAERYNHAWWIRHAAPAQQPLLEQVAHGRTINATAGHYLDDSPLATARRRRAAAQEAEHADLRLDLAPAAGEQAR